MIHKETALNIVVLTMVIGALGIIRSGAERHLKPLDQARANNAVIANPEFPRCLILGFRAFGCWFQI
jgi:hypothetical protein